MLVLLVFLFELHKVTRNDYTFTKTYSYGDYSYGSATDNFTLTVGDAVAIVPPIYT